MKENDLAHGEFGKCLERVDVNHRVAQKMIKIATLPEPERTKITSSGETKTQDEMTVRELRELKKQLKQRDEQNAQLQSQVKQV